MNHTEEFERPFERIAAITERRRILDGLNQILDMSLSDTPGYTLAAARFSSFISSGKEFSEWEQGYNQGSKNEQNTNI